MRLPFAFLSMAPCLLLAQKSYEQAPIHYETSEAIDLVSSYFEQVNDSPNWKRSGPSGYLADFLDSFDIPVESQVLVFSKTSLQSDIIHPNNPRALYFNDEIYVGWVPNGDILEVSIASPATGTNFYTINNDSSPPRLLRETQDCLRCHGDSFTRDVPGHLIRSVFPSPSGHPILQAGSTLVDHTTAIEERWGGYLVTNANMPHRGNLLFKENDNGAAPLRSHPLSEVPDRGYLADSSDVVALLVLEHQAQAHNLIADLILKTQRALHDQKVLDELLNRPSDTLSDSTLQRIKHAADPLIEYLFLTKEATLPFIELTKSPFAKVFQADVPRDRRGRSLYDLKMHERMFHYPLSYLVYSKAFNKLPAPASDYVWEEIERILLDDTPTPHFEHLTRRDKRNILTILEETHPRYANK